jgi:hypothetical protein
VLLQWQKGSETLYMVRPVISGLSWRPASRPYNRDALQFGLNGVLEPTGSQCTLLLNVSRDLAHLILPDCFKGGFNSEVQRRQLHRKRSSAAAAEESLSPSHAGAPLFGQGAPRSSFVRRSVRAWLLGSPQIRSASPSGTINHASTQPRSNCLAMSFASRKAFWQKVTCQFPTKP